MTFKDLVDSFMAECTHFSQTGRASAGMDLLATMAPEYARAIKRELTSGDLDTARGLVETALGKLVEKGPVPFKTKMPDGRKVIKVKTTRDNDARVNNGRLIR